MIVIAKTKMSNTAIVQAALFDKGPPRNDFHAAVGTEIIANIANRVPPTLASIAARISPWVKWAQDVVMPQAGQRIPYKKIILHGGSPNC